MVKELSMYTHTQWNVISHKKEENISTFVTNDEL